MTTVVKKFFDFIKLSSEFKNEGENNTTFFDQNYMSFFFHMLNENNMMPPTSILV